MFTKPTIVLNDDLTKRAYITFYLNGKRIREYNGNSLNLKLFPNHALTLQAKKKILETLQFELHKALDAKEYPAENLTKKGIICEATGFKQNELTAIQLLFEVVRTKIRSDLSKTYKRDLKSIYRQFRDFMLPEEKNGLITGIPTSRLDKFLAQFGSSGTYYMNKRRNLSILFSGTGKILDKPIKSVKQTSRRRSKAKLHKPYDKEQLRPILDYLKQHYPKLHLCCLLTYGSWLRPHEEIRLLKVENFKRGFTEVHLSGDENKGGKVRVVYIPDYIQIELEPIVSKLSRTDNIISWRFKPYNDFYFNTQWSRAWKQMYKLNLVYENQTIYSFRHTAAIDVYRRTKDVYLLQKLLGHSSIVVTLKYLRSLGEFNSDKLKEAAPTLDFDIS